MVNKTTLLHGEVKSTACTHSYSELGENKQINKLEAVIISKNKKECITDV